MENASKALIIAGAILLSILLISMGIMVYNQAAGVLDTSSLDEVAITTFNNKFSSYEGTNVSGSNVNALISTIIQNNISNATDSSKQITFKVSSSNWSGTNSGDTGAIIKSIATSGQALTGKSYDITCTYDEYSGYITTMTVNDAGSLTN